jgi:hypothetical protein
MIPRKKVIDLSFEESNSGNKNLIKKSSPTIVVKDHAVTSLDATIDAINIYCERLLLFSL